MKLKEFLHNINNYIKENPESLELEVITSKDDEGNGFNLVWQEPNVGFYVDGEFIYKDNLKDYNYDEDEVNAICIN